MAPDSSQSTGCQDRQQRITEAEPDLLTCPPSTLHVSIVPILAVRSEYDAPKEAIWRDRGARWIAQLNEAFDPRAFHDLRYRSVVATGAAVIVLIEPAQRVRQLRRKLLDRLSLPDGGSRTPELVHTTILRYGRQLRYSQRMQDLIRSLDPDFPLEVQEYVVSHEQVYPHLRSETICQL